MDGPPHLHDARMDHLTSLPSSQAITSHHKRHREESGSTSSEGELSSETEYSVSDQGGHDNRRPKRRIEETDVGASKWTLEEWWMLLTSGDASDSKESSDNDSDLEVQTDASKGGFGI
jgi:hypothetical protein